MSVAIHAKELLTVADTAELLSVSETTVRNLVKRGSIPAVTFPSSRRLYIRREDLEAASMPVANTPKAGEY
ncbi:MAG: helix-turn-helix domain-containing protein [Arcanobacterium sp.]